MASARLFLGGPVFGSGCLRRGPRACSQSERREERLTNSGPANEFDGWFRRYRRDAVLLHRPFPPNRGPRTNSKFGGLPRLPEHHEWPRTPSGVPLHFLAQIDCADIGFPTRLPERGVLFFFGRDDDEQVWDSAWKEQSDASEDCRVLYALDAFAATAPREAPADLPPIGGDYPRPAWRDFSREGERGPSVHVEWPIDPRRIDTWPDALFEDLEKEPSAWPAFLSRLLGPPSSPTWQELEERRQSYGDRLDQRRAEAYALATGEPQPAEPASGRRDSDDGRAIFFHAESGPDAWPQHWLAIAFAVRALLHRPARMLGADAAVQAPLIAAAEEWLRRSEDAGLDEPVSEEFRREFRAWIVGIRRDGDESPLYHSPAELVFESMVGVIRAWAGDPVRAARIPEPVYDAMRPRLGAYSVFGVQYSQMLGHAPSAQDPLHPDDPTICLLNLASDHGLGWMFGDVGNCTFWIRPADLARKDFTRIWGTIEGH